MFKKSTKWFVSILLFFFSFTSVHAWEYAIDPIIVGTAGIYTDSRAYSTLALAIAGIGALERDLYIAQVETVGTLTIPANVRLHFLNVGAISVTTQLTLNTTQIFAGDQAIFAGAGDIDFVAGSVVRSSWFADLDEALDVTNDDTSTLVISEAVTMDADGEVGNNVTLRWESPLILNTDAYILSNVKNIEAGNYQIFAVGAESPDFLAGSVIHSSWFTSLAVAIAATGDENTELTILVDQPEQISSNPTIDVYQTLKVEKGCIITIDAGNTLTINGDLIADIYQIFSHNNTDGVDLTGGLVREVYPQWFGATGDGATDDSLALNTFFIAAENKTAFIPDGIYMVKDVEIMDNTHVKGESFSAIIETIATAEIDDHLLRLNEKTNVIIEGLKLDGNSANTPGSSASGITMLYVYGGCSNIIIKNNLITDNDYVAIRITDTDATGSSADTIIIDGNIIDDTDCGVITGHTDLVNLNIINNIIMNGDSEGISIWGHATAPQGEKYTNISNNVIHDKTGGILFRYANFATATGNTIYSCVSPIYFDPTATVSSELTITGNNITTSSGSGISGVLEDSVISGNSIVESAGCGIWLKDASKNVIVSGNFVKNADGGATDSSGIRIEDSQNISVVGNTVVDDNGPAETYAGIQFIGASALGDKGLIANNHVRDCETYGITVTANEDVHILNNFVDNSGTDFAVDNAITSSITRNNWGDEGLWDNVLLTSASGALPITRPSRINSSGGVLALTLADGNARGEFKFVVMSTAGNIADLTIAHHLTEDDEVARFDAVDEHLLLVWTGTEWATVSSSCTFP